VPTWPLLAIVLLGCAITCIQYLLHALWHLRKALASPSRAPGVVK
jgi:hypothetical protein